jgi:hypothetical protein
MGKLLLPLPLPPELQWMLLVDQVLCKNVLVLVP